MLLKCKYCHLEIIQDTESFVKETIKKGEKYIQCPYCLGIYWIKDLE